MEGLTFEQTPSAPAPRRRNPKRFFMLLASIVVIALLLFGAFNLLAGDNASDISSDITPTPTEFITEAPTETPTPTEEKTPTPTSTPTKASSAAVDSVDKATGLDRSTLKVAVENGSGETGVAAKASDFLEGLGYNVVSVGNADTQDFQNVTIQVKSTKSNFLTLLKKDLSANYTVGTTSSDLDAASSADALVIIGQ